MKFEIVEFYPLKKEKKKIIGTVHLYIADWDMDLRGIRYMRNKSANGKVFNLFRLPEKRTIDEDGNLVRYPIICWPNPDIKRWIIEYLMNEGVAFINKRLKEGVKYPPLFKKETIEQLKREGKARDVQVATL